MKIICKKCGLWLRNAEPLSDERTSYTYCHYCVWELRHPERVCQLCKEGISLKYQDGWYHDVEGKDQKCEKMSIEE